MTIQPTNTPQPSVRMRAAAGQPGGAPSRPGAAADWMKTGDAINQGLAVAQTENAARQDANEHRRMQPMRFRLQKGEAADIIILDNDIGFAAWEHDLTFKPPFQRTDPKWQRPVEQFVLSPKEWETDPLQAKFAFDPYYAAFISIIDMRSGVTGQGRAYANVRKLLCIKGDALNSLMTLRDRLKAKNPNAPLRGVQLVMSRGHDKTAPKTGLPQFIEQHSEEAVMAAFAHAQVMSTQDPTKVMKVANADCYPYDYSVLFRRPSAAAIMAMYPALLGDVAVPGSDRSFQQEFGGGQGGGGGIAPTIAPSQPQAPTQPGNIGGGGIRSTAPAITAQPSQTLPGYEQSQLPLQPAPPNQTAGDLLDDEIPF